MSNKNDFVSVFSASPSITSTWTWKSINQSIIYLFSKEKTIINKYNEIKLNKTNKTLINNLANYLL